MSEIKTPELCPVQMNRRFRTLETGRIPKAVYLRAYEVYCGVYGPQDAMIDEGRGCRGGFHVQEIVAFLYARSFPREEWDARIEEAHRRMELE